MSANPVLETDRLRLRVPIEADFEPLLALMSDPIAAHHIGGAMSPGQTWRSLCALVGHWRLRGYGFFSVEEKSSGDWVGRVGPWFPYGWPAPEVGWTIARPYWGRGYGPEASAAAMDYAFEVLGWEKVIHLIHPENVNSQVVARKLGSVDTGEDHEIVDFNVVTDIWGQTRNQWAENRKRFAFL